MKAMTKQQIKVREAKFKAANAAQKRILVAKDVLAQVKSGKLTAKTGNWLTVHGVPDTQMDEHGEPIGSMREALVHPEVNCTACALGGLFMSCTLFNNKVEFKDYEHEDIGDLISEGEHFKNKLDTVFCRTQLKLIETAFELGNGWFGERSTGKELTESQRQARAFGEQHMDPSDRLVAIMKNIIKNNGTFKP